ncbi:hypothetical protein DPMN_037652 [Dreissena polymorpha]|uniref:Uncharacterized protein n=1 Tax=Dreissena polymorpha TaxID=45954 RepID=A0A9D4RN09_DREPO|nr:hypothetical protein DPMN_037652 [Dreissena polymorpha]
MCAHPVRSCERKLWNQYRKRTNLLPLKKCIVKTHIVLFCYDDNNDGGKDDDYGNNGDFDADDDGVDDHAENDD